MIYIFGVVLLGIIAWVFLKEKPKEFNLVSKQEARLKQGLEYLKKNREITNEQYRNLVGVSQSQATRDLEALEQEGMIEQLGTTGPTVRYKLKN